MEQILCHLIGDYWLQTDWMAVNKHKVWWIALIHSVIYTLPFMLICERIIPLIIICITHALIDGSNIVIRLTAIKNNVEVRDSICGYSKDRPVWLCVMLSIVQDNTLHLLFNYLALRFF